MKDKLWILEILGLSILIGLAGGLVITLLQRNEDKEREIAHNIEVSKYKTEIAMLKMTPSPTPTPVPQVTTNKQVLYHNRVFVPYYLGGVELSYVDREYEYIGDYFITAYCPEECGYRVYSDGSDNFPNGWITSTGTIAHREEEWWNPSTCGINTALLNYGDHFLIDGKIYVAEDTGYVTGRLIDLFKPSYDEMMEHGSHWTDVYKVSYIETEPIKGWHFNINDYIM